MSGKPGPGEARIRHTAVGLNFVDIYNRSGLYPVPSCRAGGGEGAGVVEEVGPGVTDLSRGSRRLWQRAARRLRRSAVIPAERLNQAARRHCDRTAAAMMLKGLTVQISHPPDLSRQSRDTILLHCAAGGIGLLLGQWASISAPRHRHRRQHDKAKLAMAHGCAHTIVYTRKDFVKTRRRDHAARGACGLRLRRKGKRF